MRINKFWLAAICLIFSQTAFAIEPTPWVEMHPLDLKVIENARIETKLRLHQIRRAQSTIDVVTYEQYTRETVGKPLLEALRYAANEGVRVRFLRGGLIPKVFTQLHTEPSFRDDVSQSLSTPPTKNPIQYLFAAGFPMMIRGWSLFASVHEKLLIIDGRIAFVTGRGHSSSYLNWLDTCFVIKGELVAQTQTAFDDLWKSVLRETGTKARIDLPVEVQMAKDLNFSQDPPLPLSEKDKETLKSLKQWAQRPALNPKTLPKESVFEGRLLHNDFLDQIREHCVHTPWLYNYFKCSEEIKDPIIEEMVNLIHTAQEIKFYTLALKLSPKLKEALLARLKEKQTPGGRDFSLTIFTNGKEAHKMILPYPFPWYVGLRDLNDLMQAGAKAYEFIKTEHNDLVFTHRKVAIALMPDGQDVVITGSHNLSTASTNVNDEVSIEIRSHEFAKEINTIFEKSIEMNGRELINDAIKNEQWWNTIPGWGWDGFGWRWALSLVEAQV